MTADDLTMHALSSGGGPPACTLPTVERPLRVAEFDRLFATALRALRRMSPTLLRLDLNPAVEERARDLTARESMCCSFFTFRFTRVGDALQLDVEVPSGFEEMLDAISERAAAAAGISA